jgi:hypothetical protein
MKEQSFSPNYLFSQNLDGEADISVSNNETDDCTAVDSDEDAEAPQAMQVLSQN